MDTNTNITSAQMIGSTVEDVKLLKYACLSSPKSPLMIYCTAYFNTQPPTTT